VYPTFGSISAGAAADIVILNSNPLEDIANTRSLAAVIQQGVYFDSEELNELKKPVPGFLTMR
jgi:imidazolonepropionase-like amidohydrolase